MSIFVSCGCCNELPQAESFEHCKFIVSQLQEIEIGGRVININKFVVTIMKHLCRLRHSEKRKDFFFFLSEKIFHSTHKSVDQKSKQHDPGSGKGSYTHTYTHAHACTLVSHHSRTTLYIFRTLLLFMKSPGSEITQIQEDKHHMFSLTCGPWHGIFDLYV